MNSFSKPYNFRLIQHTATVEPSFTRLAATNGLKLELQETPDHFGFDIMALRNIQIKCGKFLFHCFDEALAQTAFFFKCCRTRDSMQAKKLKIGLET